VAAILAAATRVLGERPQATIEDIAAAAGVSRQTVYAHYSSRDALLKAVINLITEEVVAAMDAADLDNGPAAAAILRLVDLSWRTFERYPLLLTLDAPTSRQEDRELHGPVLDRLERLVRRGQDVGEFDRRLPPGWLLAAVLALGHAAGEEVGSGRMSPAQARLAARQSILRVLGADVDLLPIKGEPPTPARPAG
jgi:AcrR family transcriptional regulator